MHARTRSTGLILALSALLVVLAVLSLMIGPAGLSPRAALAGLIDGEGTAGIIVRSIRLPRTLLALLIGATLGLSGAALQGLLRNPLAEPALFGAPQAAAAGASFVIAYGLAGATSFAVPMAGIVGALVSIGGLVAIAGRRASLTVTLLAGLAFASFAGAVTALILNLAPTPYAALEIAFWLLGSLEDRSMEHVWIALPFFAACWLLLLLNMPRLPGADARRRRRRLARRRYRPHPADGGDRRGARRRRRRRGRGRDRVHRTRCAASGAASGRLRSGAGLRARHADGRRAPHRRRHRGASHPGQSQRHRGRAQGRRRHRADRRAVLPADDLLASGGWSMERRRDRRDVRHTARRRPACRYGWRARSSSRAPRSRSAAGEFAVLLGPNGAGKTTLIRALAGVLPADGRIEIAGRPLAALSLRERARHIAYLPQGHITHWPMDVASVVALGRHPHADRFSPPTEADRKAVAARAEGDRTRASGIAQRDLAVGRRACAGRAGAGAGDAGIRFCSPTSRRCRSIRAISSSSWSCWPRSRTAARAVLAILHDLALAARFADRVLMMDRGRLVADGAARDVLTPDKIAAVFGVEAVMTETGVGVIPILSRPI